MGARLLGARAWAAMHLRRDWLTLLKTTDIQSTIFPEINAHPEISAHQKEWFFKGGGSTQNRWALMGFGMFFIASKIKRPGRLFQQTWNTPQK